MPSFLRAVLLASAVCFAQTPSLPTEQQYLRFILLNIASLDHDPKTIKAFETQLVKQFGLDTRESALLHAAGQTLRPVLDQNRRTGRAVVAAKKTLSAGDVTTLRELDAQRELRIGGLANQVLRDVRPTTAARLATAGRTAVTGVARKN